MDKPEQYVEADHAGWYSYPRLTHYPTGLTCIARQGMDQQVWDACQLAFYEALEADLGVYGSNQDKPSSPSTKAIMATLWADLQPYLEPPMPPPVWQHNRAVRIKEALERYRKEFKDQMPVRWRRVAEYREEQRRNIEELERRRRQREADEARNARMKSGRPRRIGMNGRLIMDYEDEGF